MLNNHLNICQDIANIIKGIAFYDISIENMKIKAVENPNFNPQVAWRQIDIKDIGKIDISYLSSFLSANRVAASQKECKYLMDMMSGKSVVTNQEFLEYILPKTNENLKQQTLMRKEKYGFGKHAFFYSEKTIALTSEQLTTEIFNMEIQGFRDIEETRKHLRNNNGLNVQQIFQLVDSDQKGIIDYDVLNHFMRRAGVTFNEDEFLAFISRTTEDQDLKLDYEELILAIMPIYPYVYPHFREPFDANENHNHIERKVDQYQVNIRQPIHYPTRKKTSSKLFTSPDIEQKYTSYKEPIRKFFNPTAQGKSTYNYDEGYMNQLKSYQERFFNPSKESTVQYTNRFEGMRYHDQYFDNFYKFLHDRNQNEQFFNKFGKRYAFDQSLNQVKDQISLQTVNDNQQQIDRPIFSSSFPKPVQKQFEQQSRTFANPNYMQELNEFDD